MKTFILIIHLFTISSLNSFSQAPDKFLIKAAMQSDAQMYDSAAISIKQSTVVNSEIYYKTLANISLGLKNYDVAIDNYLKAENLNNNAYKLDLAKAYALNDNKNKAFEYLSAYLNLKDKTPLSKINNDTAFKKFRTDPGWIAVLKNADYSDLEITINKISTVADVAYNQNFKSSLDEALSIYPSNPQLLYHQSRYFEENKQYTNAIRPINQALQQQPQNHLFLYQKALLLQKNNDNNNALISINEAIRLYPYAIKYYITRIELNKALGNNEKVKEDTDLVEFCLPENADVKLIRIEAEIEKQNYFTALTLINGLLDKDRNNPKYYSIRGIIYLKAQKYQNADNDFGMSLDLNPSDPDANMGKGMSRIKLEDSESACFYLQKALKEGNKEALEYIAKYCNKI